MLTENSPQNHPPETQMADLLSQIIHRLANSIGSNADKERSEGNIEQNESP